MISLVTWRGEDGCIGFPTNFSRRFPSQEERFRIIKRVFESRDCCVIDRPASWDFGDRNMASTPIERLWNLRTRERSEQSTYVSWNSWLCQRYGTQLETRSSTSYQTLAFCCIDGLIGDRRRKPRSTLLGFAEKTSVFATMWLGSYDLHTPTAWKIGSRNAYLG